MKLYVDQVSTVGDAACMKIIFQGIAPRFSRNARFQIDGYYEYVFLLEL